MEEKGTLVRAEYLKAAGKPSPSKPSPSKPSPSEPSPSKPFMETKVSEISIDMPAQKETCSICFNDDINAGQMFSVDKCRHRFCSKCVKRHIEVRLLERSLMTCPHYGCKTKLIYGSCVRLLTPKLRSMWIQRIKEDSIPITKRVYCPRPRCSALMSESNFSKSIQEADFRRCCVKCGEHFCIKCRVPWHYNLSCDNYKSLNPNHNENESKLKALANKKMWRQCAKCQQMIELSHGCVRVVCRCGHNFCFLCGADAGDCTHGHNFYDLKTGLPLVTECCLWFCSFVLFLVIVAIIGGITVLIRSAI